MCWQLSNHSLDFAKRYTCHLKMLSNHSLDLGGSGEDIAYP